MKSANVQTQPLRTTYTGAIEQMAAEEGNPKLVMFLGSNIGNMEIEQAGDFVQALSGVMRSGDHLLIGLDMKKDPKVIQEAYDDPDGITAWFNTNMLLHLNREFGTNFQVSAFSHLAKYDCDTGAARSYLVSKEPCQISFSGSDETARIAKGEYISTEISQKYDDKLVREIFGSGNLEEKAHWHDEADYFRDYLFVKR